MNINRLRWLSERIVNSEKKEFEEFIDTYDKDIVSFVVEACYEKKIVYDNCFTVLWQCDKRMQYESGKYVRR